QAVDGTAEITVDAVEKHGLQNGAFEDTIASASGVVVIVFLCKGAGHLLDGIGCSLRFRSRRGRWNRWWFRYWPLIGVTGGPTWPGREVGRARCMLWRALASL